MAQDKVYVIYDRRYGSMVRPSDGRYKEGDERWCYPRFIERLEKELPIELMEANGTPPADAKVVWFALPDPQPFWAIQHYEYWGRSFKGITINNPSLTYRTKQLWYYFLNENGIKAPVPNPNSKFRKTEFHGWGNEFGCEFIDSVPQNHTGEDTKIPNSSQFCKVWRLVSFNGKCSPTCLRLESDEYVVQSGGKRRVRELQTPTPPPYVAIANKVAKISGLKYFHIEIIPSPWVGATVCDVNQHPFDVMEGKLNDSIKEHVVTTIKKWLG